VSDIQIYSLMTLSDDIAMFGLLAYPAQGIYKSIKGSGKNNTTDRIRAEKLASFQRQVPTGNSTATKLSGINQ